MREVTGDLWGFAEYGFADVVVITTNGDVRKDGQCVMGRGCAQQARDTFRGLAARLGELIQQYGNRPFRIGRYGLGGASYTVASMPVKHHWSEAADIELIKESAAELVNMADKFDWRSVVMPRPGCGNGQLAWEDVRPVLAGILDDRFTVTTMEPGGRPFADVLQTEEMIVRPESDEKPHERTPR